MDTMSPAGSFSHLNHHRQLSLILLLFSILIQQLSLIHGQAHITTVKSPFFQYIPDCPLLTSNSDIKASPYPIPKKQTSLKGIICPIVRDEEGYLSEFVAYYQMHGFEKIIFYDNNSTQSFDELKPWIDQGFVSIVREWWKEVDYKLLVPNMFEWVKPTDWLNQLAGIHCQQIAHTLGIDIYVALDIDEYIVPRYRQNITVLDDIVNWMNRTGKNIAYLPKINFSPVPHFHEPINLLTIEAYQTRYPVPIKINYYITAAAKMALRIKHPTLYTKNTTEALLSCCHFHGCQFDQADYQINGKNCSWYHKEYEKLWPKYSLETGQLLPWEEPPSIHHYARSLEKFAMKQDTYESLSSGNDSLGNGQGLSVYNYLNRAYGFVLDDSALQWSCSLRQQLRQWTGEEYYLRPGLHWSRNPEFGKPVTDPRKRGRSGKPLKRPLGWREISPYPKGKIFHPPPLTDGSPHGKKHHHRHKRESLRGNIEK